MECCLPGARWLEHSRLYEPNLIAHAYLPSMSPRYDVVAVDEVQDLTAVQLALVLKSLKTSRPVYRGG